MSLVAARDTGQAGADEDGAAGFALETKVLSVPNPSPVGPRSL